MHALLRSRIALWWLALAMPFLGCAQWTESLNAFRSTGEIQGQVEPFTGTLRAPENVKTSTSKANEILVFLEPISAEFSFGSLWQIQKIAIQTSLRSSGIQLVTVDRPIRIRNLDPIHHELFTKNMKDDLRIKLAGKSESEIFRLTSPGLVRFYCVLHPEEDYTFIASSSSTYHTFVDSEMHFRIPHVRPGHYRVRAASALDWGQSEMVEVLTSETVQLTLRLTSEPGR